MSQKFSRLLLTFLSLSLLFITQFPAHATPIFTVNSTADGFDDFVGDGNCRTSSNTCTLRAALMEGNAQGGATIVIPAGTYNLTIVTSIFDGAYGDLDIFTSMTITGAGATKTIIKQTVTGGLERVIEVSAGITTITGVTLTGGDSEGDENDALMDGGGGIEVNSGAVLTLSNVIVKGNNSRFGGGVRCDQSTLTIMDSDILDNRAGQSDGGLDTYFCQTTITRSLFARNTAVDWGGGLGGFESQVTINNSTFQDNTAGNGGAIRLGTSDVNPSSLTINNSRFVHNSAIGNGGGINIDSYGAAFTVLVNNSLFERNIALWDGGGIFFTSSAVMADITNSALIENRALNGGGLTSYGATTHLTNVTVANNVAAINGGGIRGEDTITLTHVSVIGNHSGFGGAITSYTATSSTVLKNSVVANNTAPRYWGSGCSGEFTSNGANVLEDWGCFSEATDILGDPNLGVLSVLTDSGLPGAIPNFGSSLINAGLLADCAATDQSGQARSDAGCDIGAVEVGGYTNVISNGGFESGLTNWKSVKLSADKRVCDDSVKNSFPALSLTCSFQFSNPTGTLTQNIPLALLPVTASGFTSTLRLSATVSTAIAETLPVASVKFTDTSGHSKTVNLSTTNTHGTQWISADDCIDFTPTKGVVTLKFTAAKGKLTIDDLSLVKVSSVAGVCAARESVTPSATTRDGATLLGLPAAPEGFRGGN